MIAVARAQAQLSAAQRGLAASNAQAVTDSEDQGEFIQHAERDGHLRAPIRGDCYSGDSMASSAGPGWSRLGGYRPPERR